MTSLASKFSPPSLEQKMWEVMTRRDAPVHRNEVKLDLLISSPSLVKDGAYVTIPAEHATDHFAAERFVKDAVLSWHAAERESRKMLVYGFRIVNTGAVYEFATPSAIFYMQRAQTWMTENDYSPKMLQNALGEDSVLPDYIAFNRARFGLEEAMEKMVRRFGRKVVARYVDAGLNTPESILAALNARVDSDIAASLVGDSL